MNAKKVLIVSRSFYPGNTPRAHRATELAKEFCRQGHAVTVLTPALAAQSELVSTYGIEFVDLGAQSWLTFPTNRSGIFGLALRVARRILSILLCYPTIQLALQVYRKLPRTGNFDLMISVAAPHAVHWGVARRVSKGPKIADVWVADCGDPFMGAENDSFSPAFYFRWVEKWFCRNADWIAVPALGSKKGYYPEFQNKLVVISQAFKFEDYSDLKSIYRPDGEVIRFAYAGLLIPGRRDPIQLLRYLSDTDEKFEFHIYTKSGGLVSPFSDKDPRFILHDFVPRESLLRELASMDFLVNIENVGSKQTPSKLIDYWLCSRPILSLKSFDFDTQSVAQFLVRDYTAAFRINCPDQYRIDNVVYQFLELTHISVPSDK